MATYYSDRVNAEGTHAVKGGIGVQFDRCTVSLSSALAVNDVIKLFTLPKGARVLAVNAVGRGIQSSTDSTYDIGDSDDQDRFMYARRDLRPSNIYHYLNTQNSAKSVTTGIFNKYTANTDVQMKITAGTNFTSNGTIVADILYNIED